VSGHAIDAVRLEEARDPRGGGGFVCAEVDGGGRVVLVGTVSLMEWPNPVTRASNAGEEMSFFKPDLSILPAAQKKLWPELSTTPSHFTLYGGTALALRIGHRKSKDFDFFSHMPFDPIHLAGSVPYLVHAEIVQSDVNTLTCRANRGGPVLLSFFGGLSMGQVEPSDQVEGPAFQVASLKDVAATKAMVLHRRAEAKDYIDIDALIENGIELTTIIAAARLVYGDRFNPVVTLKALTYFGDVPTLPLALRRRLERAVKAFDSSKIPQLQAFKPPGYQ
jgi:hypothetical protein